MNDVTQIHHVKVGGCCFLRLTKSQKVCIVLAKQDGVVVDTRGAIWYRTLKISHVKVGGCAYINTPIVHVS